MNASIHGRRLVVALGTAAAVSLAACAPLTVSTSVDRGVDLSAYRTYGWSTQAAQPTGDPRLDGNTIFHGYLAGAIDKRLTAGGLEMRDAAPELLVRYFAGVSQEVVTTGAEPDGSCRDCRLEVYDGSTIVIDLVDARTRTLVWRGWAKGDIDGVVDDQKLMEERIDLTVARILERLGRH